MIDLLKGYLKKVGVSEFSQLTDEEKDTYRKWDEILAGRKLTDEDVDNFLDAELVEVMTKLPNPNLSVREDIFLKMKLEFINKIKGFLRTPEIERQVLEKNLEQIWF